MKHYRAMNITSLDSLGSWESIYVHFNTIQVGGHEENYFEDGRNIKFVQ